MANYSPALLGAAELSLPTNALTGLDAVRKLAPVMHLRAETPGRNLAPTEAECRFEQLELEVPLSHGYSRTWHNAR